MRALTAAFFAAHPELSIGALGAGANEAALDLAPFGQEARYFPAERHAALVERYRAANQLAFSAGGLSLPGWVLSDLYLMPGAIGLLLGPASALSVETRGRLGLHAEDEAIVAAYVAVPSVIAGMFVGVSLISFLPKVQAGAWIKALTLKMVRARRLRGVAQWRNPSVRVHTRLGELKLVGAVPGAHELGARSFVYESELADETRMGEAMARRLECAPTRRIHCEDLPALAGVLERAEAGEAIYLVPPGLDATGEVLLREERG